MLSSHRRAWKSYWNWIENQTTKEKKTPAVLSGFIRCLTKIGKQNLGANEEFWMWKTYYQAAGDNKHSAYVCLNAYLVVKNESCAKAVSFFFYLRTFKTVNSNNIKKTVWESLVETSRGKDSVLAQLRVQDLYRKTLFSALAE